MRGGPKQALRVPLPRHVLPALPRLLPGARETNSEGRAWTLKSRSTGASFGRADVKGVDCCCSRRMGSDEPINFAQQNLWKSRDGPFRGYVFQGAVWGIKEAGNQKEGADDGRRESPRAVQSVFLNDGSNEPRVKKSLDLCIVFSPESLVRILKAQPKS